MIIETAKELLGRAVQRRRKQIGLTQDDLAEASGLSKGSIGLLERGEVWPEYENLQKIASALRIPEMSFFEWNPKTSPKLELLELAASLNDDEAALLLESAKNFGPRPWTATTAADSVDQATNRAPETNKRNRNNR